MPAKTTEAEYQKIKAVLLQENIQTETELNDKIEGMRASAKKHTIIISVIAVALIAAFPKYAVFSILLAGVYLAWLWSSTLASKHYFSRYLSEMQQAETQEK